MVEQLELADHDVAFIAEFIDFLIRRILLSTKPFPDASDKSESDHQLLKPNQWDASQPPVPIKVDQDTLSDLITEHQEDFVQVEHNPCESAAPLTHIALQENPNFKNMEDKDSEASAASEVIYEDDTMKSEKETHYVGCNVNDAHKNLCNQVIELDFRDIYYDEFKIQDSDIDIADCIQANDIAKNWEVTLADIDKEFQVKSLENNCSHLFSGEEERDVELRMELDAIALQYQQWFQELSVMREKAISSVQSRWKTTKNPTIN